MKSLILTLSLLFSFGVYANCYDKLTSTPPYNSKSFFIYEALDKVHAEELNETSSVNIVDKLLKDKVGCLDKSIELEFKSSCKELMPGKPWSKVCYVESRMGYFVIQMDMMEGFHVIFNRWD